MKNSYKYTSNMFFSIFKANLYTGYVGNVSVELENQTFSKRI